MNEQAKPVDNVLLALIIVFAILPIILRQLFVINFWPLIGGDLLNPMSLSAYAWLILTYINYRRRKTNAAAGLFLLLPVAFAAPASYWLVHFALAHHRFGH